MLYFPAWVVFHHFAFTSLADCKSEFMRCSRNSLVEQLTMHVLTIFGLHKLCVGVEGINIWGVKVKPIIGFFVLKVEQKTM